MPRYKVIFRREGKEFRLEEFEIKDEDFPNVGDVKWVWTERVENIKSLGIQRVE